ncbi:protein WHAT'S THIS FACTOR 1 homolog, chloroplastic [Raphanus sativus]|uniref:Protein WHAT'S THIS FACTOR 1 homolog, chloroplastic n=1 Tax=Raphanus sativus TaxID=3726 RepID=A0A6J0LD76_RAPSA|nr:protein WHAT'S THIS FACTOR 1 homolog, chloroplastic [Raphanus sativus]
MMMTLTQLLPCSPQNLFLSSTFLHPLQSPSRRCNLTTNPSSKKLAPLSFAISCSAHKIVRNPSLDKHVVKQNRVRFVQKLKTLLLSKPKHYIPIQILYKCSSYLGIENPRTILSMIRRYPTIFQLFTTPTPHLPMNATKSLSTLCVRMTPAASSLALQELNLKSEIADKLATKLQKLLMLSSHRRLLLSKLVHIGPDLGFPPNFRSRLCNDYPDKFKTVDTSYGRALELVSWEQELAKQMPSPEVDRGLIVDRPLKFKRLNLRRGLNLKRRHQEYLIKFGESPDVCPYKTSSEGLASESIEAEKRACAVVREVLGLTVEKRTLIDHLTHFRQEFGLPNKLRGLIVRHPELFYVSVKGTRDSVFLVEAYNDNGDLLEKDETLVIRERLIDLVQEGKRIRRERRRRGSMGEYRKDDKKDEGVDDYNSDMDDEDEYVDGFENLFSSEDSGVEYHFHEEDDDDEAWVSSGGSVEYWSRKLSSSGMSNDEVESVIESW